MSLSRRSFADQSATPSLSRQAAYAGRTVRRVTFSGVIPHWPADDFACRATTYERSTPHDTNSCKVSCGAMYFL